MRVEGLAARVTPDSCRNLVPGRDWFGTLADWSVLDSDAVSELRERGFAILPGAVPSGEMEQLAAAYGAAVASATGDDVSIGSTSTRVTDFVNRRAEFDRLYVWPPLLEACRRVIARPFKLSCWSSTGRPGTATGRTCRASRGDRSRARSSHGTGTPRPTSRPVCDGRRANGSARSRGACLRYDDSCRWWHFGHCPRGCRDDPRMAERLVVADASP